MHDTPNRFRRLLNYYRSSRLCNINVNIVVADVLSTAATALVIETLESRLGTDLSIVLTTAIVDGGISLAIFATLHTYANRSRGVKDLFRVQVHRWVLSPLHYIIGAGTQFVLLKIGAPVGASVLIAYLAAVAIVRTIHTIYGKKSGLFQQDSSEPRHRTKRR